MNMKRLQVCLLAGFMGFSITFTSLEATSREEIARIQVVKAEDFKYWNYDSPTKAKIINFVEETTNPLSKNYIPPEDRIVTFDMDGTFYCETAPYYFQEMMFLHRVLEDEDYHPTKKITNFAKKIKTKIFSKTSLTDAEYKILAKQMTECYKGMTPEEYRAYVKRFMNTNEIGLSNLKRGEAFYLPMVEIISYLSNNDFKVYINSACGIDTTRTLLDDDIVDVRPDRIIASDFTYTSTNMGKEIPETHFYDRYSEKVIINGPIIENGKVRKIFSIINHIGKRPVLAFGNSMGDSGMLEYVLQDNKYPSMSFFVLCDDVTREFGNIEKAEKLKSFAISRGWNTISMQDEFKTIYGDDVIRTNY